MNQISNNYLSPSLRVYKASAGSGKTFTLAAQYIGHLIIDPSAYSRILAVTFTNKATAEMKDRILAQLNGLATSDPTSDSYLNILISETGLDADTIRKNSSKALQNILHDYGRFRVETIDSFFQSVVRNMARELGLGTSLNIELDNAQAVSDALDSIIESLNLRNPMLYTLIEYIDQRMDENKKWESVIKSIKQFGRRIFDEHYIRRGQSLRQKIDRPQYIDTYRNKLLELRAFIFTSLQQVADNFFSIIDEAGLQPTDFKRGESGICGYFRKLSEGQFSSDIFNASANACHSNAEEWVNKTSPLRNQIIELASDKLMPLLWQAESERQLNEPILNSINLSLYYLNDLKLLNALATEINRQNRQLNRFLLADTNALLHNLISEGDATFIYEKIGTNIDIVMIDEFQDTSRLQWENFRILIDECLSHHDGSLIVGDIKQSIYRWRNGDWKILANIGKNDGLKIKTTTLDTNWRSEKRIIEFNNVFFHSACSLLATQAKEFIDREALYYAYSDVEQKSSRSIDNGYVKVIMSPKMKVAEYLDYTLAALVEEVHKLHSQGIELNDMAILIRHKKYFNAIAEYFDMHTNYRIVSDEAFYLSASQSVNIIIDALTLINAPDHSTVAARLALYWHQFVVTKDFDIHSILTVSSDSTLPPDYINHIDELRLMPLYELAEEIYRIFHLRQIEGEDAYICYFFDCLSDYCHSGVTGIGDFIRYWEDSLANQPIPSGEVDGIRIMTIHASKGLEYHTVLIPFCDWTLETEAREHLIWCTPDINEEPFAQLDLIPLNYSKVMERSIYKHDYYDEQLQLWIDNLNLLYVAFTRACKNLIIYSRKRSDSVAELIEQVLNSVTGIPFVISEVDINQDNLTSKSENIEPNLVYEWGTVMQSEEDRTKHSSNRFATQPLPEPVRIESVKPGIEFRQSNLSEQFINGETNEVDTDYIYQGQLLHKIFAEIQTPSDLPVTLNRLSMEGLLDTQKREAIHKIISQALKHPIAAEWFTDQWTLYNECTILYHDESGMSANRRPDRVMRNGNRVVVVDFKFGNEHLQHHIQVTEYLHLVQRMGYSEVEGYLWYVYQNRIIKVE